MEQQNKLQLYFDYYVAHHNPKANGWYWRLDKALTEMDAIQSVIRNINVEENVDEAIIKVKLEEAFNTVSRDRTSITDIPSFLERFVFQKSNGVGDVGQGQTWDTTNNPDNVEIRGNATAKSIYEILICNDKVQAYSHVANLLKVSGRNLEAVKIRLLRTLFPNDFVSPDAPSKFHRLLRKLNDKLNIKVTGSLLDQHGQLCDLIRTDNTRFRQMFTWEVYYLLESELSLKKAICYYGAPGTGKTYRSSREAKKAIDNHRILIGRPVGEDYKIETVQFHPSYSYEDFIEGIRPSKAGDLKLFNGSFKQFCKVNSTKEIDLYSKTDFLNNESFKEIDYDFSQIKISELKPKEKQVLGITTDVADGVTIQDVIEPAFFIIDEINRAELSKVFGELMYSLEYRGYKGKIKTQYGHLCDSKEHPATYFWEKDENWFFIPQNIYLIATMNNIDRSVDAFDFALRRRFMWQEVVPNYGVIQNVLSKKSWKPEVINRLIEGLKELNSKIENDNALDKNYRIGHSYLLELAKLSPDRFDANNKASHFIWKGFIAPLLEEYLKDLGNEQKAKEKIVVFKNAFCK